MSKIISCEQLRRLARHHAGIGEILTEALLSPDHREPMPETIFGEIREFCDPPACELSACGHEASDPAPAPFEEPAVTSGWREEELRRREREMGRLCGRWMSAPNRCGIEIVRAGEHFVLRYLKRNGRPTGERYVLVWLGGDILYYGSGDRITILALDTQTDTLMVSPGEDYTRQRENER